MEFYSTAIQSYLIAVAGSRTTAELRVEAIVGRARKPAAILGALLRFVGLRRELSYALPRWLEIAAECSEDFPALAGDLREAAALECSYRQLLAEDFSELLDLLREVGAAKLLEPPADPRIERLATSRGLVPTRTEPWSSVAVELELRECARRLERALLEAAGRSLPPTVDARRFLRTSVADADNRIALRRARLGPILQRFPDRVANWANVAATLTRDYLAAIEAAIEAGVALAEPVRAGPSHSPSRSAMPAWG